MVKKIAVYPGSFDPPTNGHLDVIERAISIFDELVIVVVTNPSKKTLFSVEERVEMMTRIYAGRDDIEVADYDGLLIEIARKRNATTIVRGLRAVSDFEYEFEMALMNRKLDPDIKSIYLMPSPEFTYLSSSIIKEVFSLGGDVDTLIPPIVKEFLEKKYR
ncbi:MAG: pantetheine-phosphate adenylyltransferase [Elusimicrobiota bacterium]